MNEPKFCVAAIIGAMLLTLDRGPGYLRKAHATVI